MTNTLKYGLGALALLLVLFFSNKSSQKSYNLEGKTIFTGEREEVYRILFKENDKALELILSDTTWTITQADSF